MRYRIRDKVWSIRDRYLIRNPEDQELFVVEGKLMSLGKKLTFATTDGRDLARIEQKLMAWRSTYRILRDGAIVATVRKMFRPIFHPRFVIEIPGANAIEVNGNFLSHEFRFEREGEPLGTVSKKMFSWSDSYGVDIDDDEDQVLLLCATVVIDLVCHEGKRS